MGTKAEQPANLHDTVYRGFLKNLGYFVNLSDDFDEDGINWRGTKEEMVERLIEYYGLNWSDSIEIQRWQLTEERIDHITGDGIDYRKSF